MKQTIDQSRRRLVKGVTLVAALSPIAALPLRAALAADLPLVSENDPTAKALQYVSDASKATSAKPGSKCANCANYRGAPGPRRAAACCFRARR